MSIRQRIESILADGPATPNEIAPELGITKRSANANMCDLARRGLLVRAPFRLGPRTRKRSYVRRESIWIYSLPEQVA